MDVRGGGAAMEDARVAREDGYDSGPDDEAKIGDLDFSSAAVQPEVPPHPASVQARTFELL
jgi:hypothetical protein